MNEHQFPRTDPFSFILAIFLIIAPLTMAQQSIRENVPIVFYGKVVDQSGSGVEGAKVSVDVIEAHFAEDYARHQPITVLTGKDGDFTITGVDGHAVDFSSIEKDGYELSKKIQRNYSYTIHENMNPDPHDPVIFRIWKKVGKESLIGASWHGKVACDGTSNRFDLLSGRQSADGNLEMECIRDPLNYEPTNREPYTYKFEITFIGGGVQATEDEFSYRAPADGYLPKATIERKPGDAKWRAGIDQEFYFKTSDGNYGRISVVWGAGHRPAPTILEWECSINPSGSRNLER